MFKQVVGRNTKIVNSIKSRKISGWLYKVAKGMMPKISPTERAALNAGTVGFDRDIFSGTASLKDLEKYNPPQFSADEQSFMDNEVEELCAILDDYDVTNKRDMPYEFWEKCKQQGFFGMIIPKEYGGRGFSAHMHSQVVQKISTRCGSAAATVTVPNSLGPGELLMRYGTTAQKDYFLPNLAKGNLVPCFGLTAPHSGSDAASMSEAYGEVVERNGKLGIVASFNKRYITLAPVAGVVGLAFQLKDPKGLLKGEGHEGITIALLERDHEGLQMGPRHDPLVAAFMNGTVKGNDVFIPMESIIGGQERCGFGWNMLMDCLAEGRSVSLPASAVGGAKLAVNGVGAYARLRKQFRVPIAEMGGVQEALARIGANAYILTSAQQLVNSMLLNHEQPAVLSAVMKFETTSRARDVMNDSMDVMGGAGICRGPANIIGNTYMSLPIAITVEGANILTRSMITFGQGLNRAHPNLIKVIDAIERGNDEAGFMKEVSGIIGHAVSNTTSSVFRGMTRSRMKSKTDLLPYYESNMARLCANFAIHADLALVLGGRLKFEEMLSGRFADAFSTLYLGYACMWHYKHNKHVEGIDALFELSMETLLQQNEDALITLSNNFPVPGVGLVMRTVCSPFGRSYHGPTDEMRKAASGAISTPTAIRDHLSQGIYISDDKNDQLRLMNDILDEAVKADKVQAAARKEKRSLTHGEQELVDRVAKVVDRIIQVDSFDKLGEEVYAGPDFTRPALLNTKFVGAEQKKVA